MKKLFLILFSTIILHGCSDHNPPIYKSGMSQEQYGEQFGAWLGNKLSDASEADIEAYSEESTELVESFKRQAKNINSSENAIALVDKLIAQIIKMTQKQFNLSENDWIFIANPTVDKSASKSSQWKIKRVIREFIYRLSYSGFGYFPTTLTDSISKEFKDKENGDIYYSILKKSKYSKMIANDQWFEEYKAKNLIINSAIKIAQKNTLYFDSDMEKIESSPIKYNHNVQVFVKTYIELINQGIDEGYIAKYLTASRSQIYNPKKYENQKKIKLEHYDKRAFEGYIKTMSKLLNKKGEIQ